MFPKKGIFLFSTFAGGQTICGAFGFRFGDEAQSDYSPKKLTELRENLSELKLIIIDEISLVKSDMLYQIHRRLCEIFPECSKFPFGKRSVIAVGDLMQVIKSYFYSFEMFQKLS